MVVEKVSELEKPIDAKDSETAEPVSWRSSDQGGQPEQTEQLDPTKGL